MSQSELSQTDQTEIQHTDRQADHFEPDSLSGGQSQTRKRHVPILTRNIVIPFILLTTLFAWWGLANNMTDTLLPAFKRIMSLRDGTTAWIQVVCYALGYGCFAI
ncbi:MAG: hypothetical protein Q4G59_12170, partial [Planctomycetia bacterium]|nr:hypothetical protein [Planctomycetia bacterium]